MVTGIVYIYIQRGRKGLRRGKRKDAWGNEEAGRRTWLELGRRSTLKKQRGELKKKKKKGKGLFQNPKFTVAKHGLRSFQLKAVGNAKALHICVEYKA